MPNDLRRVKTLMHNMTNKMQTIVSAVEYQYWDVAKTGCREIGELAEVLVTEVEWLEKNATRHHNANHTRKT